MLFKDLWFHSYGLMKKSEKFNTWIIIPLSRGMWFHLQPSVLSNQLPNINTIATVTMIILKSDTELYQKP